LGHFSEWKKINDEGEEGLISLDTFIKGTCDPPKLLDLLENFILFQEAAGGSIKIFPRITNTLGLT